MPVKRKKKLNVRKKSAKRCKQAKKTSAKRLVKKKKVEKKKKSALKPVAPSLVVPEGLLVGKITHYFPRVMAGVVKLSAPLNVGDQIYIKGHTTDLKQAVTSMQINRVPITTAKKGQEIGLLVQSRVRRGDKVFKIP